MSATASASMIMRAAAATLALLATRSCALARNADREAEAAPRDKEATVLFAAVAEDLGEPFDGGLFLLPA